MCGAWHVEQRSRREQLCGAEKLMLLRSAVVRRDGRSAPVARKSETSHDGKMRPGGIARLGQQCIIGYAFFEWVAVFGSPTTFFDAGSEREVPWCNLATYFSNRNDAITTRMVSGLEHPGRFRNPFAKRKPLIIIIRSCGSVIIPHLRCTSAQVARPRTSREHRSVLDGDSLPQRNVLVLGNKPMTEACGTSAKSVRVRNFPSVQ